MSAMRSVPAVPHRWHWLIRGFQRYAHRYVRKHFHAVRLSKSGSPLASGDEPLLVVLNHPSWWDPLIGIVLSRAFGARDHFAAIDAVAVRQYRFFQKLGFVGVDTKSLRGAAEFLRTGAAILAQPRHVFWVTAQGRFTDVRERPLALRSGVGHLAARLTAGIVLPVALEYTFWTERTPEALVRVGEPLQIADHPGLNGQCVDCADRSRAHPQPRRPERGVDGPRPGRVHGTARGQERGRRGLRRLAAGEVVAARAEVRRVARRGDARGEAVTLLVLAWMASGCAAVPALLYLWNSFLFREPPQLQEPLAASRDGREESLAKPQATSISVLIPARNEELGIEACLRSVLASRHVELEVIVLDDG